MEKKIRVLVAKPGLDGHNRGAKLIARALRDNGMEVIYTGLRQSPENIAMIAIDEDVDVIGLSILSGAHKTLTENLFELLKKYNVNNIMVLVGGIIPKAEIPYLLELGVSQVFGPGTDTNKIVQYIKENIKGR